MLRLNGIVGFASEPALAERLHDLGHRGGVEYLLLDREDTLRHRLRVTTDQGTECAITLPRTEHLSDGAVVLMETDRAILVRMNEEQWLALEPVDDAAALELGYHAGNLHWRVRFDGPVLLVAREGPAESYLDRLKPLLGEGRVHVRDRDG